MLGILSIDSLSINNTKEKWSLFFMANKEIMSRQQNYSPECFDDYCYQEWNYQLFTSSAIFQIDDLHDGLLCFSVIFINLSKWNYF